MKLDPQIIHYHWVTSSHTTCHLTLTTYAKIKYLRDNNYKKITCVQTCRQRHTLWLSDSSFMSARCVLSEDDWSLKETSSNATFTARADLLLFFIISASPPFPSILFPRALTLPFPLHALLILLQVWCVPSASNSGIISQQFSILIIRMTSAVTFYRHEYLRRFYRKHLGAEFITVCSWILIKGVCVK